MTMTIKTMSRAALLAALASASPFAAAEQQSFPPMTRGWVFNAQDGKELYQKICQGCHMADGKGASGAGKYPALANNPRFASSGYIVSNVLNGRAGMPGFGVFLTDAQVLAVSTYVRASFGNSYTTPITLEEVKAIRKPAKGLFDD
jgi:mono/diheme cytochrome c family protein